MAFVVNDKVIAEKLNLQLDRTRREHVDSLEKLSSGQVFTSADPRPSERALAENLEYRLRSLAASKRNVNDAVSLLQTAESSMSVITDMVSRMKEINVAASNTTMDDRERRYLFIEYEALFDEVNRIALTTEYNGIPLLNGASEKVPEALTFRIDTPVRPTEGDGVADDVTDLNSISFPGIKQVIATPSGLGLKSAKELLIDSAEGGKFDIEAVNEMMTPENDDEFSTVYDQALGTLSVQRAIYGAMQSRLDRSREFMDVYQENIAAAKSKIADTDYAREVARMAQTQIMMQATTGLLAQSNTNASLTLNLLNTLR